MKIIRDIALNPSIPNNGYTCEDNKLIIELRDAEISEILSSIDTDRVQYILNRGNFLKNVETCSAQLQETIAKILTCDYDILNYQKSHSLAGEIFEDFISAEDFEFNFNDLLSDECKLYFEGIIEEYLNDVYYQFEEIETVEAKLEALHSYYESYHTSESIRQLLNDLECTGHIQSKVWFDLDYQVLARK